MMVEQRAEWQKVGRRIASARRAQGLSREVLAEAAALPVSDLKCLESGEGTATPGELARLATRLGVPLTLFFTDSPPSVVSLRNDRPEGPGTIERVDLVLETLARDVEFLQELGELPQPIEPVAVEFPETLDGAESVARTVRDLYDELVTRAPTCGEYVDCEVEIDEELSAPTVSQSFSGGVISAYRKRKISAGRALEMLRGTLREEDLPEPDSIPLQAYARDLHFGV